MLLVCLSFSDCLYLCAKFLWPQNVDQYVRDHNTQSVQIEFLFSHWISIWCIYWSHFCLLQYWRWRENETKLRYNTVWHQPLSWCFRVELIVSPPHSGKCESDLLLYYCLIFKNNNNNNNNKVSHTFTDLISAINHSLCEWLMITMRSIFPWNCQRVVSDMARWDFHLTFCPQINHLSVVQLLLTLMIQDSFIISPVTKKPTSRLSRI